MNRLSEVKWIESVRVESNPVPASAELERDPPVSLSRVTLIDNELRSVPSWSASIFSRAKVRHAPKLRVIL